MITITVIENLVDKRKISGPDEIAWEGKTIAELAPQGGAAACNYGGKLYRPSDAEWNKSPEDGAVLVFVVTEEGQRGLGIGLIVVGALLVGAGLVLGGAYFALFKIGVAVGMSGVFTTLNSFLAPSSIGLIAPVSSGGKQSPSYGFSGIQNTIANGTPISVVYGEHDVGGHILQVERRVTGESEQTLYMLIGLSQGPIQSIGGYTSDQNRLKGSAIPDGIRINGMDAKTYRDVEVSLRLGAITQTIIPGFENVITEYSMDNRELAGVGYVEWATRARVNAIEAILSFPRGVYKVNEMGELERPNEKSPKCKMQIFHADGFTLVRETEITFNKKDTAALFASIRIDGLAPAKYIVRIFRTRAIPPIYTKAFTKSDYMYLDSIKEIIYGAPAYNGIALLGLKIRATQQISGGLPNVISSIKGRKVLMSADGIDWDASETWTNSPPWIVADILTHPRYGLGALISREDLRAGAPGSELQDWKDYEDFCDEIIDGYTGAEASYGQPIPDIANQSSALINPSVSGTYSGSKSGFYQLMLVGLVADTSANFQAQLIATDGTQPDNSPVFTGTGLNDLKIVNAYTGTGTATFEIEIVSAVEHKNKFRWRKDAGAWSANIEIEPEEDVALSDGVVIQFSDNDFHVVSDTWEIEFTNFTFTNVGPVAIGNGLSITLALDPNVSTSGWSVGDIWRWSVNKFVQEKRFVFNGIFDTQRSGWESALAVTSISRALLLKVGAKIKPQLEKVKTPVQIFTSGNINRLDDGGSSVATEWLNPNDRANQVEVIFDNEEKHFAGDQAIVSLPNLSEAVSTIVKKSVTTIGITSPYQARRFAAYLLRAEQNNIKLIQFDTSLEAIAIEPGDVFFHQAQETGWSYGGRVAGASLGNVQLDQEIAFESGKLYTYIERNSTDDSILTQDFIMSSGSTDVLPFAPLHAGDPTGRIFKLGTKYNTEREKFMALSIGWKNGGMDRQIGAIVFDLSVYTDDAEDLAQGPYINAPSTDTIPELSVSALIPLTESVPRRGWSNIRFSGGTSHATIEVSSYQFIKRIGGEGDWEIITTIPTPGLGASTGAFDLFESQEMLGTPYEVKIITIMPDGRRLAIDDATTYYINISRDDDDSLVLFPGDVDETTITFTQVADNNYDITWDDPSAGEATPDGYEVRVGEWASGIIIADFPFVIGGGLLNYTLPNIPLSIHIRAYKDYGDLRYFSPADATAESPAAPHPTYGTEIIAATDVDFTDVVANTIQNGVLVDSSPWINALKQNDNLIAIDLKTAVINLGTSAPTNISIDARVIPWINSSLNFVYMTMKQWSSAGLINTDYIDWNLDVDYSTSSSTNLNRSKDVKKAIEDGDPIVITARYLRLHFSATALSNVPNDPTVLIAGQRLANALLERLKYAIHRV